MDTATCYHCGEPCNRTQVIFDEKNFCCHGCKTVFEIFEQNELSYYYDLQEAPGSTPDTTEGKFDFLDTEEIVESLLTFDSASVQIIDLYIPNIHCSSCIWMLENLNKLHSGISSSQVDFPRKTITVTYQPDIINLKELVLLLAKIGYEPNISLNDFKNAPIRKDRSLWYKIGVAGFAFGNIMFLSFPEYFEVGEFWLEQFKGVFRWLMLLFSLPVVFYSGRDYLISAYKGIRAKMLNIDVPIALGILVLFLRSTAEVLLDLGSGFFDSLTGLIFFLLLGRAFQQKTYSFLSFERDYKSYFPIAATRINADKTEESVQIYNIK
ncbi:MAG: heavy metal translocating P-type ATPase metal-binding domain-containing protein, partial [Eudoraea sp.]|nr:heavy metal translocating P-type ATPase metal-binding domain-containing protein [Eudoraea sp.]